jgi:hypothetical protein
MDLGRKAGLTEWNRERHRSYAKIQSCDLSVFFKKCKNDLVSYFIKRHVFSKLPVVGHAFCL